MNYDELTRFALVETFANIDQRLRKLEREVDSMSDLLEVTHSLGKAVLYLLAREEERTMRDK